MTELPVVKVSGSEFAWIVPLLLDLKQRFWHLGKYNQLSLTRLPDVPADDDRRWSMSCGSLIRLGIHYEDGDYDVLNPEAEFLQPVLDAVAVHSGQRCCRVMLMELQPKSCYSYHQDATPFRYHVPVVTHQQAFFVVDDYVYRMSRAGSLYRLQSGLPHTAVNASYDKPRLHLVISTTRRFRG